MIEKYRLEANAFWTWFWWIPWSKSRISMLIIIVTLWGGLGIRTDIAHYLIAHHEMPPYANLTRASAILHEMPRTRYGGTRYIFALSPEEGIRLSCRSGRALINDCYPTQAFEIGQRYEIAYFHMKLPWYVDTRFYKLVEVRQGEKILLDYMGELIRQEHARNTWLSRFIFHNLFMIGIYCIVLLVRWRAVRDRYLPQTEALSTN